jgi:23S rRNA (pseudouridine1915-N3)-methyltransferase
MKLLFVFVGGSEDWSQAASEIYLKKIKHFCECDLRRLKPARKGREDRQIKAQLESKSILDILKAEDFLILCDERGVKIKSIEFSKRLVRAFENCRGRVVIAVGGAFGATEELRLRAQLLLSLSELTLSHEVAQTAVLEQIYRALCIWRGLPYHNES